MELQQLSDSIFSSNLFSLTISNNNSILELTYQNKSNTFRIFRYRNITMYVTKETEQNINISISGCREDILKEYLYNSN